MTQPTHRSTDSSAHRASRRAVRGFTMIELLVSIGITLILMAIVGELLSQVRQSVGIGTANGEVITYAGAIETRLRDDFRRLDPRGFLVIKWADKGSSATIPAVNFSLGAGVITAISPPAPVLPFNVNAAGLETRSDITVDDGGSTDSSRSIVPLVITDSTGSGAKAIAFVDFNSQITSIKVISGGANYTAPTARAIGQPIDQISFVANGPWITSRYGIQTTNIADSGYRRTFQTPSSRIYYGHLAASTNSTFGPYLLDHDENNSLLAPRQFRLGRHALLISPEWVRYNAAGTQQASTSLWQATDVGATYGIRPGLSDVAMLGDAASIRNTITDINNVTDALLSAPPVAGRSSAVVWDNTRLPGQRMGDLVFRIYGSPYAPAPISITPESHMLNQALISANCSGFKVEVSNDGSFTDLVTRPTAPSVFAIAGSGVGNGMQDANLQFLDGGKDLDTNNTTLEVVGGGGSGAILASTIAGGILTAAPTVATAGAGYTGAPHVIATTTYAAGYGLGTADHCQPMPRLIRVTVTLQDQRGRIHDLFVRDPSFNDGRTYSYVLEVPQPN
ncbi:MAG: prepilin-type N-terminal cleavage/methylation domain-containing protein [Planctomycetota bacterium]|nr:prepilin-type N-terminal cleavage/methylation domain-containing protein [Planctomycetota bacterium]